MNQVEFECHILPGAPGWASCDLRIAEQSVSIGPFSHVLTEGIDDLVRAATAIVSGAWEQTFSMDDEPEPIWRWRLKRHLLWQPARSVAEITIERVDDVVSEVGKEVFHAMCDPDDFGRAVASALRRLLASEPPESLQARWSRFPIRALTALEAALSIAPH